MQVKSRTIDPEAYDAYLKGNFHWEQLGKEDIDSVMYYFQMPIDKDPDWALPYAGTSLLWAVRKYRVSEDETTANDYDKQMQYLNKALELDPNSANSHYISAGTAVWTEWDWEKGESEFLRSLALNPNDALCRMYYAHLLMILHRHKEAIDQANLALELDPLEPLVLGL